MSRYPFSPEILDAMPEGLAELYRDLEAELLARICSQLRAAGELNEVSVQDLRVLRSHGISLEEIERAIQKTAGIGEETLDALLDDVTAREQRYHRELVDLAQVTAPPRPVSVEDVRAVYEQTRTVMRNITRSMGFLVDRGRTFLPPARAYQWALDQAELRVMSGAVSYTRSIRDAVKELADSGLRTVDYESGHTDQADVAVRRAVMTGVNQLCQRYADASLDDLGTDLVEVSAHRGARDIGGPKGWEDHKKWQGRVYRWSEKPRTSEGDYPDFVTACGLGDVQGIEGANCRHHYSAFVEGVMERTYTDDQLAAIDPPPFEYQGRTYTAYEATQKQREIERTVRKLKRERSAFEEAGLTEDATAVRIRLRRLNGMYREFSAAAGLPLQRERMAVYQPPTPTRRPIETASGPTRTGQTHE